MRFLFLQAVADPVLMGKDKIQIIRPAGMTGDDFR